MNKQRRAKLSASLQALEVIRGDLEEVRDAEQDTYDQMPANLQNGARAETILSAVDTITTALDSTDEAIDCLRELDGVSG
jgi:hypothetical protein